MPSAAAEGNSRSSIKKQKDVRNGSVFFNFTAANISSPLNLYAEGDFYIAVGIKFHILIWGDSMKGNKKKNGRPMNSFVEKLSSVRMNICGNREVVFEGSKGVVEYNENSIKINSGKYLVAFAGRGLHIKCMNEYDLIIEGFITSIEYIM